MSKHTGPLDKVEAPTPIAAVAPPPPPVAEPVATAVTPESIHSGPLVKTPVTKTVS